MPRAPPDASASTASTSSRLSEVQMCALRGDDIGMVFQEPMTALNPVKTIGEQVAEGIRWHTKASRAEAEDRARKMLDRVGLPRRNSQCRAIRTNCPAASASASSSPSPCALKPKLLIADEPTTALDVVLQAQILDLLARPRARGSRMGLLLISHDLAVVTEMADRVAVMKDGQIVEQDETAALFANLSHPYTRALAADAARTPVRRGKPDLTAPPVLEARAVVRDYPGPRRFLRASPAFRAVSEVSLAIRPGEIVGLVGESGCGKSTLLRTLLALEAPQGGQIRLAGETFAPSSPRALRRHVQVVFQDPHGSFDPRWTVERLVAEPLHLLDIRPTPAERRAKVEKVLSQVGLPADAADRYPHQFSGGQRQRIAIARALIVEPSVIALDEAVSALDVTVRAEVLDLLARLSDELGLAYLFVSHDMGVVRGLTDRVLVMKAGRIVEEGPTAEVFSDPQHPYTAQLIAATPDLQRALAARA
jgi:peptide/nickel transport system ATP-binding protein